MKRHQNDSEHNENLSAGQQHAASHGAQVFADSDELLHFDAAQTIVPPGVAQRLQQSLPAKSVWWKKLLGL
jgi:hypothetical protein